MSTHVCNSYTWQKLSQCQMKLREAENSQLCATQLFQIIEELQTFAGIGMEHYKNMLKNLQRDDKIR